MKLQSHNNLGRIEHLERVLTDTSSQPVLPSNVHVPTEIDNATFGRDERSRNATRSLLREIACLATSYGTKLNVIEVER